MNELLLHILLTLCSMRQRECFNYNLEHPKHDIRECFKENEACMEPYEKFKDSRFNDENLPKMDTFGHVICSDLKRNLKCEESNCKPITKTPLPSGTSTIQKKTQKCIRKIITNCDGNADEIVPNWETQPVAPLPSGTNTIKQLQNVYCSEKIEGVVGTCWYDDWKRWVNKSWEIEK